jgi:hypothetical protein
MASRYFADRFRRRDMIRDSPINARRAFADNRESSSISYPSGSQSFDQQFDAVAHGFPPECGFAPVRKTRIEEVKKYTSVRGFWPRLVRHTNLLAADA